MGFEFICNECGRDLGQGDDFSYAAFLYGVFFLEGPEDGFVGTTCPSCLKTAYIHVNKPLFEKISDSIRDSFWFREFEFSLSFYYLSSPVTVPLLEEPEYSNLLSGYCYFTFRKYENIQQGRHYFNNDYYNSLYNSYGYYNQPIIGDFFHNIWVTYDQAIALIMMETKTNVRTIPRFVFRNPLLENAEGLFHRYKYNPDAEQKVIEMLQGSYVKIEKEHLKEAEFSDTLVTKPISNIYLPHFDSKAKKLWTKQHPFYNIDSSNSFHSIVEEFTDDTEDYSEIYELLNNNYNKNYSLKFLEEYLDYFLHDYVNNERFSIMKANWSHANLWKLTLRYLGEYDWTVNKGLRAEENYFFYREGDSFRIKFGSNRKPKSGLTGIGFKYLHHLMCHEGEAIPAEELYLVCHNSGAAAFDSLLEEDLNISQGQDCYIEMADSKTRATVKERIKQLQEDLVTLKASGIKGKIQEIKHEIEELESYLDDCFWVNGKVKIERSSAEDKKAGSVNKAIDDALKKLASDKVGCKEVAEYFKDSLIHPHGRIITFHSSDEEIKWFL